MRKIQDLFNEYNKPIGIFVITALIFVYTWLLRRDTNDNGIITVAKVISYEGAESGSDLYIDIHLEGKIYRTSADQIIQYQYHSEGNYFFVKVLRNAPTKYAIFYGDKKVPDCILNNESYFKGWKNIPTCDNYKQDIKE